MNKPDLKQSGVLINFVQARKFWIVQTSWVSPADLISTMFAIDSSATRIACCYIIISIYYT